jgi:hypothetical protein
MAQKLIEMPQGQYRVRRRSEHAHRPSEDRARREHGDYLESARKLELQREEGLERTRQRLEQQREELARLARVRSSGRS